MNGGVRRVDDDLINFALIGIGTVLALRSDPARRRKHRHPARRCTTATLRRRSRLARARAAERSRRSSRRAGYVRRGVLGRRRGDPDDDRRPGVRLMARSPAGSPPTPRMTPTGSSGSQRAATSHRSPPSGHSSAADAPCGLHWKIRRPKTSATCSAAPAGRRSGHRSRTRSSSSGHRDPARACIWSSTRSSTHPARSSPPRPGPTTSPPPSPPAPNAGQLPSSIHNDSRPNSTFPPASAGRSCGAVTTR